jgi:tetratricopeptide (TPR) repeat protein
MDTLFKTVVNISVFLIFSLLYSCVNNVGELKKLTNAQNELSVHLVDRLFINNPTGFHRAKYFDGFQNDGGNASISVKLINEPLSFFKSRFSKDNLKTKKWELIEISPAIINNTDSALYVAYIDKKKQIEKFDLAIRDEKNNITYFITSFKQIDDKNTDANNLKNAILSSYLGDVLYKDELFKFAGFTDGKSKEIYTKDGNYPTNSPDKGVIEIWTKSFPNIEIAKNYLDKELKIYGKMEEFENAIEKLDNGSLILRGQNNDEKYVVYYLLFSLNEISKILKFTSNSKASAYEFIEYARGSIVKYSPG